MPEVPEITILSQYLLTKLKGRIIKKIEILSGKYTRKKLLGIDLFDNNKYKISNFDSKGKLMWCEMKNVKTNKKIYMLSHLGLSGEWNFHKQKDDRIRLTVINENNDKTYVLCYNDPRNFGNLEFTENYKDVETKLNKLAPDALKTNFSNDDFIEMVKIYLKKSVKRKDQFIFKVLMSQKKDDGILSGLGNYLTPEILYDAKISPFIKIGLLTDKKLIKLANSIKYITKLSYYNNDTGYMTNFGEFTQIHKKRIDSGKYTNYHSEIKIKKDEKFVFKIYRQKTDPEGNNVEKDLTINKGRTVYWVPNVQK